MLSFVRSETQVHVQSYTRHVELSQYKTVSCSRMSPFTDSETDGDSIVTQLALVICSPC